MAQLRGRLDELVAAKVLGPGERRLQRLAIGALIVAGLHMAIASPVLAVLQASALAVATPMIIASLTLAAAAYLSATGALDHVAWLVGTLLSIVFGLAALAVEAPLAAWLLVLAIAPGEATIAGRRKLALGLAGSAAAVAGVAVFLAGHAPTNQPADIASVVLLLAYVATVARRSAKRPAREERPAGESGHRMADAAELFGAAMLSLDVEGRIVFASKGARILFSEKGGDLEGQQLLDSVLVADRIAFLKAMADAKSDGHGSRVEARLLRPDGRYVPAVMRLLVATAAEDPAALVHIAVTRAVEEGTVDQGLQAALDAAQQSSAAKSQFLAAVSHELRTPLNAIIGFSDILDQEFFGGFESERQKEYVGLIRQSGQHLLSVVNSLLDVSKIEAGRYELAPEPFSLDEAVNTAAGVVREEARRKDLRLDVRSSCQGETIVADRRACHQILLNLLSNAVKFTDSGVITLESQIDTGAIELSVSDTGIGIAEADIERLGRPFTQLSSGPARRYQGTGLGLSLVKGLAELHGGSMTIRSQPGIGTMVTVRLPTDCTRRTDESQTLKENIVALSDARTKTTPQPKIHATRRTA
ncbi:MAG TPA: PAS domain-containing sensor histidine kinase [Aurantimonas sp.]|uniref:histidine kinase n=1 Tax=Aurantimonas marianensis TaxID=2920428 RepID=A0A9X2KDX9_9HYPH|nr:PAS domain-containing sensor histidine kinase [Aurantimonas marianensis]